MTVLSYKFRVEVVWSAGGRRVDPYEEGVVNSVVVVAVSESRSIGFRFVHICAVDNVHRSYEAHQ